MTPQVKEQMVLAHEGQTLMMAGSHGNDHAVSMGHCVVDGVMNALVRMEGPEKAAEYAFALADRIVGAVKSPTPLPFVPHQIPPPTKDWWWSWAHGCLVGFVAGMIVGAFGRSP
jgi:hypothetical protein